MTFDDDFVRLVTPDGPRNIPVKKLGLSWPPPEEISVNGVTYQRQRMSSLSDEERAGMTHVARGAEYRPVVH